jgi:hypothetical protein
MWLPGTKGTTNGVGVGAVNFFTRKRTNFFVGQILPRKFARIAASKNGGVGGFQRENGVRRTHAIWAKKFLDASVERTCAGFQRENRGGRGRTVSGA